MTTVSEMIETHTKFVKEAAERSSAMIATSMEFASKALADTIKDSLSVLEKRIAEIEKNMSKINPK